MNELNKKLWLETLRDTFTKDRQKVLDYMSHNDPNGEYSMADMLLAPMDFIEVLEQWKEDLGYESTEKERIKIDELISILYVVELAKRAE